MNNKIRRITVFCGSSPGYSSAYMLYAEKLGQKLANADIELVYGGAKVGLMGAVADGVLSKNGRVIGVLPKFLKSKEVAHENLTELILVDSMHERKKVMDSLSDGAIALPGGFGTLEELFEMLTWGQLGLHKKPIGILNVNGYYDDLLTLLRNMKEEGFLKESNYEMVLVSKEIEGLLDKMRTYTPVDIEKWIDKEMV